jgi:hypothetical protein
MIVILRSETGEDVTTKAAAIGGTVAQYRPGAKAAVPAVRVEAVSVADALALAGSGWVHAASGAADDVAALLGEG